MNSNFDTEHEIKSEMFLETFEDQNEFITAAFSGMYNILCLGGDVRSGKTIVQLLILIILCKVYPGSRWAVIRKDNPNLTRMTIPTFFKWCVPSNFASENDLNKSKLNIKFPNKSEIIFLAESIDTDPDLNKFKGLEVNGGIIEQAEEIQYKTYLKLIERSGQWKIDPMPPTLIMLNCNPNNAWPKVELYDKFMNGELEAPYYFKIADINKNPHITTEYKELMKKTLPPEIYKRYYSHQWEAIDDIYQLNSWEDIYACKEELSNIGSYRFMGVDVGHDGPDPSIWIIIEGDIELGANIIKIEAIPKTKIPEVKNKTIQLMAEYAIVEGNIAIDTVGLGAGVADMMEEDGIFPIKFKGSHACDEGLTGTNFVFANARAWSNWLARDILKNKKIGNFVNTKLKSDAGAIKYEIKNGKSIYIQEKEQIKKKLGRSPDYWDAFTYAIWAYLQDRIKTLPGITTL